MNDPYPSLVAGFDQLAANMRPVAAFYASFHQELIASGIPAQHATYMVAAFMAPFAAHTWAYRDST